MVVFVSIGSDGVVPLSHLKGSVEEPLQSHPIGGLPVDLHSWLQLPVELLKESQGVVGAVGVSFTHVSLPSGPPCLLQDKPVQQFDGPEVQSSPSLVQVPPPPPPAAIYLYELSEHLVQPF